MKVGCRRRALSDGCRRRCRSICHLSPAIAQASIRLAQVHAYLTNALSYLRCCSLASAWRARRPGRASAMHLWTTAS